jgi:tRNA G18 (ribose-2'-O)-methylase SpoU
VKYLIIENVRSAHNVGAMFRTAEGAGVSKIFLVGYTPTPIDRFGRTQPEIVKTSLGASEKIPWESVATVAEIIEQLREQLFQIVALEQTERSIMLKEFIMPDRVAYIVGNEVDGVSKVAIDEADTVVELPMLGEKESLNVATATGILLYHDLV